MVGGNTKNKTESLPPFPGAPNISKVSLPYNALDGARQVEKEKEKKILEIRRRARGLSRPSEIIVEVFVGVNGRHEVVVSEWYALCGRESVRHADGVLDLQFPTIRQWPSSWGCVIEGINLSPIELNPTEVVQLLRRELAALTGRRDPVRLLDEGGPDLGLGLLAQLVVLDAEVDAALDRLVEDGHPVRRQDHDALEVLELAQEDGDEGVVREVVLGARFEENVGFVEEQDGFPAGDEVKDLREPVFEFLRVETQVAGTYLFGVSRRHSLCSV